MSFKNSNQIRKTVYRHEMKYLINCRDKETIKLRLKEYMQVDPNAVGGSYKIRSLYFDDYDRSAYQDKNTGLMERKKYRIRIYNDSDSVIRLECKQKSGSYIHKYSASLTRTETEAIINGDCGFLLKRNDNLCREFYYMYVSRVLRPVVIVDYEREPYIFRSGDVRITFDTDVRSAMMYGRMFDSNLPASYVLEDGKLIMEVKYTEFMPLIIARAVLPAASEFTAASKYTLCLEKSPLFFPMQY